MNRKIAKFLLMLGVFCCSALYADVKITYLDVTQGDCIIIRNGDKTIMIDAGDDKLDAAARYIIPYFKKEGIKKVDQAIITHPHRDHFGGFIELVKQFKFGEVVYSNDSDISSEGKEVTRGSNDAIVYDGLRSLIKSKNIPYRKAQLGEKLNWGEGIVAEVLSCDNPKLYKSLRGSDDTKKAAINPNEISIVVKMTYGKTSFLFTGDAEKKAETEMVERFGKKLHVDVLKSGHHGSKTSSNHNFMDAVQPTYGVIQVGKGNSFGHPTKQTLDIYDYYKMKVFRNDLDGTIEAITDGNKIEFISNQSDIQFTSKPKVISLTGNSATIQWTTNREAVSKVIYSNGSASNEKVNNSSTKTHTVTLTGLKPNTDYTFTAISSDPRETSKFVECKGSLKTQAGSSAMASIAKVSTNFDKIYMKHPFKAIVSVKNPAETDCTGLTLELYHSAMNPSNIIDKMSFTAQAKATSTVSTNTKIDWLGNIELIAVLKKGNNIIDTATTNISVEPKMVFVDCNHGNKDYFTGRFAGMKMDLFQNYGFQLKSLSKGITYETIKDGFMVIMPHPSVAYTNDELNALKKFTKAGGSILMFGQSDYSNKSHPEIQNKVLDAVGSSIHFNDDQVCDPTNNIGAPFRFFVTKFPSKITGENVSKLLFRTCCSLISSDGNALKAKGGVTIVAMGDEDSYNQEADEKGDGYKYSVGNIPVAAVEDLGVGRVGCICENTYQDNLYGGTSNKGLSTPEFNRSIIYWLSLGKEKTLRGLARSIADLDFEPNPEVRATKFENLSNAVLKNVRRSIAEGGNGLKVIKREMENYESESINLLKRQIQQIDTYEKIYSK